MPTILHASDFLVIGCGMAGASVAACLAEHGSVRVLEREDGPGYHSTGRSAALFTEIYGNAAIRALTRGSRAFLQRPPDGFSAAPLLQPRRTLYFATPQQLDLLRRFRADPDIAAATRALTAAEADAVLPVFAPGYLGGAVLEDGSADIDVDALHQGFLRRLRALGGEVVLGAASSAIERRADGWQVETPTASYRAPVLIDAAGAWGDAVARQAGVAPVGLQPRRRTALLVDSPAPEASAGWPAAIAIDESFYFKPEAGRLLLSPADESPCEPCDAQPEELDIALAVDRFEQATGRAVRHVRSRWAGLRVFSADRTPVVGYDAAAPGFFWLVGQGGYGIQTAPALARLAAALVLGEPLPADLAAAGVDAAALSPARPALGR